MHSGKAGIRRFGSSTDGKTRNFYCSCLWFIGMEYRNNAGIFPLPAVLEENYRKSNIHSKLLVEILHFSYVLSK